MVLLLAQVNALAEIAILPFATFKSPPDPTKKPLKCILDSEEVEILPVEYGSPLTPVYLISIYL